jgi:hypothetical protein
MTVRGGVLSKHAVPSIVAENKNFIACTLGRLAIRLILLHFPYVGRNNDDGAVDAGCHGC